MRPVDGSLRKQTAYSGSENRNIRCHAKPEAGPAVGRNTIRQKFCQIGKPPLRIMPAFQKHCFTVQRPKPDRLTPYGEIQIPFCDCRIGQQVIQSRNTCICPKFSHGNNSVTRQPGYIPGEEYPSIHTAIIQQSRFRRKGCRAISSARVTQNASLQLRYSNKYP